MAKENVILKKSFEFALAIVDFSEKLEERKKFIVANQILKSGTSIGANVREAQGCESKEDCIHKLKIAAKVANETEYWLLICKYSKDYLFEEKLLISINEILKLLTSIISSSKRSLAH